MKKTNNAPQFFYISALREKLREQAVALTNQLTRSVTLVTTYDSEACLEYGDEIKSQQALIERLYYFQHCRNGLEQCIAKGAYSFRYSWSNGPVTVTRFQKTAPNRVKVEWQVKQEKKRDGLL